MSIARRVYRIAHILPWASIAGTELATLRIAQALEGDEFRSVPFSLGHETPVAGMFSSAGFETATFRAVQPSYRRPRAFLLASFQLAREFRRRKIDLVHCADVLGAHYTAIAARLSGRPVLCHVRSRHENISRRDQTFLRAVNEFAFVSHDTWRRFGYHVAARRGRVVYDGIDVGPEPDRGQADEIKKNVRREFGIPDRARVVGMVARVAEQKDYATLARAAVRVVARSPDVRFLMVGDHSQAAVHRQHYQVVQHLLARHHVTPYFIFTDFRADVPRLMSAIDIFVLSTHAEGLPLVILEAMAQAKPVVATAIDGIPEIVRAEETGLLYRHQDDEELAARLLSLLDDPARAATIGSAARRFVGANFARDRFAAEMADLYRAMLAGKACAADASIGVHSLNEGIS